MECRGVLIGLVVVVMVLVSGEVEVGEGAVACGTVTQKTAACLPFVRGSGAKPGRNSPCCSGIRALDSLASASVQNRRDICTCLENAAKIYKPSPQAVAGLPSACGASNSFSLSQNCNALP